MKINLFTHIILELIQSTIIYLDFEKALDHLVHLTNSFANKLIFCIINENRDSNESIFLLKIVVSDLLTIISNNALEFPLAIALLKSLTLQLISNI